MEQTQRRMALSSLEKLAKSSERNLEAQPLPTEQPEDLHLAERANLDAEFFEYFDVKVPNVPAKRGGHGAA